MNSLLNFSRTSATEFTEIDIHQVITETISLLEHQFKTARIRVERELKADCPMTYGNAGKLQQVFLNLFVNARDAMPAGGELRILTDTGDSKIEILVQDTGIGISRENVKKIYDPFFTTKAAGKGTGLGPFRQLRNYSGAWRKYFGRQQARRRNVVQIRTPLGQEASECLNGRETFSSSMMRRKFEKASSFLLTSEGLSTDTATTGEEGLKKIEDNLYDAVLLDLMLPGKSGMEVQKDIKRIDPTLPVVIITAIAALETAITAIKEGSFDYVTKPWNNEKLVVIVRNAIKQRQLMSENLQLRRALKERFGYSNIIGKSEKLLKVLDLVTQVAASRSTILIQGESGTGKELIAKAIHLKSPRADRTFVPVNSGSMPVDLLESTLFGHLRGAFTSAIASKKGLFEVADQGTIFFDEIGTISMETQAKLLRVIQEKEFMRLGATDTIKVDARIIAATNVDLKKLVDEGRFREDLYYRLNVINIQLPPLRERKEDIPALVEFFTRKYCEENAKPPYRFSSEALKVLMDYYWPGNVRELENVVERAVVLSQDEIIGRDLLPESVISPSSRFATLSSFPLAKNTSLFEVIDSFERRVIIEMLEQTGWSQTDAADNFKIPLSTLNQKIKRHGIEIKKKRERPTVVPTSR